MNNFFFIFLNAPRVESGGQLDYELMSNLVSDNNPYIQMQDEISKINDKSIEISYVEIAKVGNRVARVKEMTGA